MKLATLQSATAVATSNPRVIECTVADLNLKRAELDPENLAKEGVLVYLDFVYQDDSVQRVWASGNVSKGIRDRSIMPENYGTLVMAQQISKRTGNPFWEVQMPDRTNRTTITIDGALIGTKPIERKKVDWKDLVSLGHES